MLVENNKFFTNQVVAIKLTTGEEIIGRAVEHDTNILRITNPASMVMVPSEKENEGMVAFAPWMLAAGENTPITLNQATIVAVVLAHSEAADQYSRAIGEEPTTTPTPKVAPMLQQTMGRRGGRGR